MQKEFKRCRILLVEKDRKIKAKHIIQNLESHACSYTMGEVYLLRAKGNIFIVIIIFFKLQTIDKKLE